MYEHITPNQPSDQSLILAVGPELLITLLILNFIDTNTNVILLE